MQCILVCFLALNPKAFVDGVMNGFSLHIDPPRSLCNQ